MYSSSLETINNFNLSALTKRVYVNDMPLKQLSGADTAAITITISAAIEQGLSLEVMEGETIYRVLTAANPPPSAREKWQVKSGNQLIPCTFRSRREVAGGWAILISHKSSVDSLSG